MALKVIGPKLLIELIKEEQEGIVSSQASTVIKARVKIVGIQRPYNVTATQLAGGGLGGNLNTEYQPQDIVWVHESSLLRLPFDETLAIVHMDDIVITGEPE